MKCPYCQSSNIGVVDSRFKDNGDNPYKYRRRDCRKCGKHFTTYEVMRHDDKDTHIVITASGKIKIKTTSRTIYDATAINILRLIKEAYDLEP